MSIASKFAQFNGLTPILICGKMVMMDRGLLAKRIRGIRDKAGLSQEFFAAEAKIARGALQGLEGAKGNPTLATIEAIEHKYRCEIAVLHDPDAIRPTAGTVGQMPIEEFEAKIALISKQDDEIERLIRAWRAAPDERNRASFLYFLTGDDRELDRAGKEFRKKAIAYFRGLGLKKAKGHA